MAKMCLKIVDNSDFCWLIRVSLLITSGGALNILSQEMSRAPKAFGSFMITRPVLECSHWWKIVYTRMLSIHHFFMMSLHMPAIGSMMQHHIFRHFFAILDTLETPWWQFLKFL